MRPSEDRHADAVDGLVRSYLDRQIEQIDVSLLRARLQPQLDEVTLQAGMTPGAVVSAASSSRVRRPKHLAWLLASSAALMLAFWGGRYVGPKSANAATVLHSVRDVHSQAIDRCYLVHYAPDERFWDGRNSLQGPSQSVLWTRGDRFQADCTIGDLKLAIGRDVDGLLWISSTKKTGVLFEGSDSRLPEDLETLCAINSMSLPRLIDDVLADFDFRAKEGSKDSDDDMTLIWADLKAGRSHPLISSAVIEVETESNAIERLVVWVLRHGRPNGTVTFTLIDSGRRDDAFYQMKSQLDADADIDIRRFDGSQAVRTEVKEEVQD